MKVYNAESIAQKLGQFSRVGKGWKCKCPCHDDKTASLIISDSDDDIRVHCFAGCEWQKIRDTLKSMGLLNGASKYPLPKKQAQLPLEPEGFFIQAPSGKTKKSAVKNKGVITKYGKTITYNYQNEEGVDVAQKIRKPGKIFFIKKLIENLKIFPLYNLPAVLVADTIYICEGEKDADNLIKNGLCATTNITGAKEWKDEYNIHFEGKSVCILEDNDEAGKIRTKNLTQQLLSVAKELRIFAPTELPEKGDVSDWLNNGGKACEIWGMSKVLAKEEIDLDGISDDSVGKKKKKKEATKEDYYKLIDEVLNKPRRCIFSDKLMTYEPANELWNPAINYLDILKAEAITRSQHGPVKFNTTHVLPFFASFEAQKSPELLVDIPKWDGIERIRAMCEACKLEESAGVSVKSFSELVREWCAGIFRRLEDPIAHQNRLLILQGPQGAGKDTLISMLVDGLGQWSIPISVLHEDKDLYLNLSRGLVCKLSEFDRSSKIAASTIKDLITSPSTNLREPYGRDAKVRINRCSFISSANVKDLLRDHTGSRRFLIFELEKIEYLFEGWTKDKIKAWRSQCVAEMQVLYKIDYKASKDAWREMNSYLERGTPDDPADTFLDQFLAEACKDQYFTTGKEIPTNDTELVTLVRKTITGTRLPYSAAMTFLRQKIGVHKRVGNKRFWIIKIPQIEYKRDEGKAPMW